MFKNLTKENENLQIYQKIMDKFFLNENINNILFLGSYMISIDVINQNEIENESGNYKFIENKIKQSQINE